jgi:hypothetical protein
MNLGQLATRAKELVQRRGGTESLKEDAEELRDVASGPGSVSDKAKAAAGAVKEPGVTPAASPPPGAAEPQQAAPPEDVPERRGRRGRGGRRRRRGRRDQS